MISKEHRIPKEHRSGATCKPKLYLYVSYIQEEDDSAGMKLIVAKSPDHAKTFLPAGDGSFGENWSKPERVRGVDVTRRTPGELLSSYYIE